MSFRNDVFGRPGVIAATSGTVNSADLRARGAQTVYWWMKLNRVAGTPSAPTDAATVAAGIIEIVDKAVAATECPTPVIVLNELNSAGSTTPWTPTNDRYRANVLEVLQGIAARGGHPLLLLSARPYTGGDALAWWQQVGQVAHIVREVYFPAPPLMRTGAVLASRTMRQKFRQGLAPLLKARHPAGSRWPRDRLPVRAGQGRPRGSAADHDVASLREAPDARRQTGRVRAEDRQRRQLGLGNLRHGRRRRRQAEGGVRVPVGARPEAVRRARWRQEPASTTRARKDRSRCRRRRVASSTAGRSRSSR